MEGLAIEEKVLILPVAPKHEGDREVEELPVDDALDELCG